MFHVSRVRDIPMLCFDDIHVIMSTYKQPITAHPIVLVHKEMTNHNPYQTQRWSSNGQSQSSTKPKSTNHNPHLDLQKNKGTVP